MPDSVSFTRAPRVHLAGCRWFWAWAVLGSAAALGFFVVGVFVVAPFAVVAYVLASRPAASRSAFGLLSGIGVLLVFIAWLQRAGPGTTCWQTATASGCDHHLNPLPWLFAGVALFAGGMVAHILRNRPA
jgi:hypothetical protein